MYRSYQNIDRRKSCSINVGKVQIGGNAPISVQTMTNTLTTDIESTLAQISRIEKTGADLVRISIPDQESAQALKIISKNSKIPIITADLIVKWSSIFFSIFTLSLTYSKKLNIKLIQAITSRFLSEKIRPVL